MKKRIFSFLLAVLMLAALLPTAAFADESTRKAVPVTGGNIYVDMEKGEVVDCDDTVTEMIVPSRSMASRSRRSATERSKSAGI